MNTWHNQIQFTDGSRIYLGQDAKAQGLYSIKEGRIFYKNMAGKMEEGSILAFVGRVIYAKKSCKLRTNTI